MNFSERRGFLKDIISFSGFTFLGCKLKQENNSPVCMADASKVVICRDKRLRDSSGNLTVDGCDKLMKKALSSYFDPKGYKEGLRAFIQPHTRVSIKLNCLAGKGLSTEIPLVNSLTKILLDMGVAERNIIIWDRLNDDLERAGYTINTGNGIRCFGNDIAGYSEEFHFFGQAGSLLSRIVTDFSDVIINMPVLKDHGIVGLSAGMKNMFGAIHNPNKYHLDAGNPFVADVYAIPQIRNKTKLTICDATRIQYEAGPPYHPKFCEDYNSIIVSEDPVALDYESLKIIERKRKEHSLRSLIDVGRYPAYIFTAADSDHKLGYASDDKIEIKEVEV